MHSQGLQRAIWIGFRQWTGLPGEFDFGQEGWVWPRDEARGVFGFYPELPGWKPGGIKSTA